MIRIHSIAVTIMEVYTARVKELTSSTLSLFHVNFVIVVIPGAGSFRFADSALSHSIIIDSLIWLTTFSLSRQRSVWVITKEDNLHICV
jgi:hypothetical protein